MTYRVACPGDLSATFARLGKVRVMELSPKADVVTAMIRRRQN